MPQVTAAKLMLAAAGLVIWGYGIRASQPFPKWLGVALLVSAVILRFVGRREPRQ